MTAKDIIEEWEFAQYSNTTYESFIGFVRKYLAPHMKEPFVEEEYYRELWEAQWEHRFNDAQISRGHSKTEFACWTVIWFAVYQPYNPFFEREKGHKKKMYEQLIMSSDHATTGEFFDRIKYYFRNEEVLTKFLPENTDEQKNNTEKLELKNGSKIYARSIKTKRGLHPDRILPDDLTTESSTLTDEETWKFFTGAVIPMGTAHVAMIWLQGTPLRVGDIMSRVRRPVPDEDGNDGNLWHHIHLPAFNRENGKLLSPNRFTMKLLMETRALQGSSRFESEYMLNPIDNETSLIKREWIEPCCDHYHTLSPHRAHYEELYMGWDFAFSDRVTADKAVGVTLGRFQGKLYLIGVEQYRGKSGLEQLQRVKELHAQYSRYEQIGLEENSIVSIIKEVRQITMPDGSRLPIKMFRLGAHDDKQESPTKGDTINIGKQTFIMRLATLFQNKEIVLPYKTARDQAIVDELISECTSWALEEGKLTEIGPHPDIPVALGYAVEASKLNNFVIVF